ncbi:MAG: hypothetical protein KGH60_00665 [Candidatus Micrarchaeota archaeon]|nr:hypothetical protein [Candidatus Micrarchaeota archaeon]
MAEYEELLKVVEQIEGSSAKQELNFVDMSSIMEAQPHGAGVKYADLIGIISRMEVVQKAQREEQLRERQRLEIAAQRQTAQIEAPQQPREPAYERYEAQMAKGVESVKGELGSLATRLGTMKPKISELRIKRINTKDLVLPSLSMSDQISELERIIEGLRQGVFDSEHLDVVRQEVFGLDQVIKDQERAAKGPVYKDQMEQSLASVRAQRIEDAESLLSAKVGG